MVRVLCRVFICENHLDDLHNILKLDILKKIRQVDTVLTDWEKCVVCSHIFVARGGTKRILKDFLISEGFCVEK